MHPDFIQQPAFTRQKAFTLLELLVAIAVFAVMSSFAYVGLQSVLTTQVQVEQYAKRLAQVQLALFRLQQDIEQAGVRPVRDEYERLEPAFIANPLTDDALILTRYGWDNPLNQTRSQLQRMAYQFREGRLIRRHWLTLDRSGISEPLEAVLLDNLTEVAWRYLDDSDEWHSRWPAEDSSTAKDRLPRAVEVTLTLRDWGDITRLLIVPH